MPEYMSFNLPMLLRRDDGTNPYWPKDLGYDPDPRPWAIKLKSQCFRSNSVRSKKKTMDLMMQVYDGEGKDPVKAYSRALTMAVMAGAMLELSPDVIAAHCKTFSDLAGKVIKDHPEIYGAMTLQ